MVITEYRPVEGGFIDDTSDLATEKAHYYLPDSEGRYFMEVTEDEYYAHYGRKEDDE